MWTPPQALLAVKLAQSTTHFLCAGAAITIPQSLQWVEKPANADVYPLKRLLSSALERSNVQAQVCALVLPAPSPLQGVCVCVP